MKKKIYAVIGSPIAHSLSPAMQNAAFQALGLDGEYIAVHVPSGELGDFVADARKRLAGFNITVPHKNAVIPFLDEIDPEAAPAGSINTVTNLDGHLRGTSTDGYGLETALREAFRYHVSGNAAVFLGCGGAARAVAFHFARKGLKKLFLLNRTLSTAESLAAEITAHFPSLEIHTASIADLSAAEDFLNRSTVAIQCTSLGLKSDDPPPIPPELLPEKICFFDTIYKRTRLLQYAEEKGIPHADGLGMLLHQGAKSFSIWTGQEAPLEAMRKALQEAHARQH